VNVPSRNEEVVQNAEQQAVHLGMPVTIARATFEAILNSSVPFEQCIVSLNSITSNHQIVASAEANTV
jgi:chorismate mutase